MSHSAPPPSSNKNATDHPEPPETKRYFFGKNDVKYVLIEEAFGREEKHTSEQIYMTGRDYESIRHQLDSLNLAKKEKISKSSPTVSPASPSPSEEKSEEKAGNKKKPELVEVKDSVENLAKISGRYANQVSILQRLVQFQQQPPSSIRDSLVKLHELGLLTIWKNDNFQCDETSRELELDVTQLVQLIVSVLESVLITPGLKTLLESLRNSISLSISNMIILGGSSSMDFKVLYELEEQVMMFSYKFTKILTLDKKCIKFLITFQDAKHRFIADLFSMSFSMDPKIYIEANFAVIARALDQPLPDGVLARFEHSEKIKQSLKQPSWLWG